MLTTMGHVRQMLREAAKGDEDRVADRARLYDTFEKLAQHIRENPVLTATHDGIDALNGIFWGLKPGDVPSQQDVDKQTDKVLKWGWEYNKKDPAARRDFIDRWIKNTSPGEWTTYGALDRAAGNLQKRPKTAPQEGETWGKYIFSPHREDVPLEPDVPDEARAYAAVRNVLFGNKPLPGAIALRLQTLMKAGEYQKVLAPAQHYKFFYRGMANITTKQLASLLGHEPDAGGGESNVRSVVKPKRVGSSWSTDRGTAERYAVGGHGGGHKVVTTQASNWSVVLTAARADNPTSFILNPDVIYDMGDLAGNQDQINADDSELYGVGPIRLSSVTYKPAR